MALQKNIVALPRNTFVEYKLKEEVGLLKIISISYSINTWQQVNIQPICNS